MTFRAYTLHRYPRWETYPLALRREWLPKLKRDYRLATSGPIGRAKVRFAMLCGYRVRGAHANFDLAIQALTEDGVIK